MPQSLSKIYLHLIFSTKNREKYLFKELCADLYPYIGGVINNLGCKSILVGGHRDHMHILFCLGRNIDVSNVVREIKTSSSKWIKEKTKRIFNWQAGYGVFSISKSQIAKVENYINNQEEHHRRKTFQEEFLEFLKAYEIEYDIKYLWD